MPSDVLYIDTHNSSMGVHGGVSPYLFKCKIDIVKFVQDDVLLWIFANSLVKARTDLRAN